MKVLFLSTPPPDEAKLFVGGHPSAADLACRGIAQGLYALLKRDFCGIGFQITKVFPRMRRLVIWPHRLKYASGMRVFMMPGINIALVRELCEAFMAFVAIVSWTIANRHERRIVLTYNLAHPPFEAVMLACRLTGSKYVPVLHDMGLVLYGGGGLIRKTYYRWAEVRVKRLLPRIDGAAIICDAIKQRYLPNNRTMLLDGGITDEVVRRLFPLERTDCRGEKTVFIMAGGMTDYNGVSLLLKSMQINKNPKVELRFAGSGPKVNDIKGAAESDSRIVYLGSLTHDELFCHYKEADCILNIRITEEIDTSLYFPSKFLEALATGRLVLSTCTGHLKRDYGSLCELVVDEMPKHIADRINDIASISRAMRDEKGKRAREYMLANRTWSKQTKRLLTFIEELK